MHTCCQLLSLLIIDRCVNNILLQTVPDINAVLHQLIIAVYTTLIHSQLHDNTDALIHWVQVWDVWWPEIRTNEIGNLLL